MADLDFRIEARLEAPKQLDDVICSDKNRRIRLLRIDGTHVLDRERDVFRKARRRRELDSTMIRFGGAPCAQVFKQKRDKARIRGGIEQGAFAWALAHGGERAWILSLGVETGPFDRQGQQII